MDSHHVRGSHTSAHMPTRIGPHHRSRHNSYTEASCGYHLTLQQTATGDKQPVGYSIVLTTAYPGVAVTRKRNQEHGQDCVAEEGIYAVQLGLASRFTQKVAYLAAYHMHKQAHQCSSRSPDQTLNDRRMGQAGSLPG